MRYKKTKKFLIFYCLLVGIGAIFGSICMFIDPSGKILCMDNLLPYFDILPLSNILFNNYIFSGIALLIVNGLSNLLAVYLLINNKKSGIILGTIFGLTLMLWIIIQFIILPMNIMSTIFFLIGLIQLITGYMTYVFYFQENFIFNPNIYHNINNNNKSTLVVYFSRMGYTKKVAYEIANKLSSAILELKTLENTNGTIGFWWCGRYGMHKWCMPIENIEVDLSKYKKIIIVSPIWVFSISAPIREFCYKYKENIPEVEYVFTHFMKHNFLNVANEVDIILNKKRTKYTSICIRLGRVISYQELK